MQDSLTALDTLVGPTGPYPSYLPGSFITAVGPQFLIPKSIPSQLLIVGTIQEDFEIFLHMFHQR